MKTKKARLDIMVRPNIKQLLKEKAFQEGCSISEYVEYLVRQDVCYEKMRIQRIEQKIEDIWSWTHPIKDEDIPF